MLARFPMSPWGSLFTGHRHFPLNPNEREYKWPPKACQHNCVLIFTDAAESSGQPPEVVDNGGMDKETSKTVSVRIPSGLYDKVVDRANLESRTVKAVMERIVESYFKRLGEKP